MNSIKCGIFNILASALGPNEFVTFGGDEINIDWTHRREKILQILIKMLEQADFIVTIENDHFHWFLNQLNDKFSDEIGGLYYLENDFSNNQPSVCRRLFQVNPKITFETECGQSAADFSSIYGKTRYDPYISDDGIAIYYRKSRLKFRECQRVPLDRFSNPIYWGNQQYIIWKFEIDDKPVSVCAAHLSSGEDPEKELERVSKLGKIFTSLSLTDNPILLMDSNSSKFYETQYYKISTVSKTIVQHGFKNILSEKGNECFKMRNSIGGQPSKYGQLMFDSIDQICIPWDIKGRQLDIDLGFQKYPVELFPEILEWRTSEKREQLFQMSVNFSNIWNFPDFQGKEVYDKKGKYLFEMDANQKHRFGTNLNDFPVKLNLDFLQFLYPGPNSPSDHPPILAEIEISNP